MKCCDIHAGMLREPVVIESLTLGARDAVGGYSESWSTLATVRGHVKFMSGAEQFFAQRLQANASVRVTIRYRSDLNESMRAVIRDVNYQIRAIENVEFRDRWLVLTCERGEPT